MCRVLGVSWSGCCARRDRPHSEREMTNRELYKEIKAVSDENEQVYASPRICDAL